MYRLVTNNKDVCKFICTDKEKIPNAYELGYENLSNLVNVIELILKNSSEEEITFTVYTDKEA